MDFLPPESNAMSSLLAIISDPKKAQARLDDLNKQTVALNSQVEEARKNRVAAEKAQVDADKARAEQLELKQYNEGVLAQQQQVLKAKLDEYDRALRDHQTQVAKDRAELEAHRKDLVDRERTVASKDSELSQRETVVSLREKEAESLCKDYEDRVARIKAAI